MSNCYNLDGIQTQLRKELTGVVALREAWEKVTFPTKKDGSPFQNMSKNINGATYYKPDFMLQAGENRVKVHAYCNINGYIYDEIDCYCSVNRLTHDTMKAKRQNYQPKQSMLEQIYVYDMDDIKTAIAARIAYLAEREAQLKIQLDNSTTVYNNFKNAYAAAVDELAQAAGKEKDSTLYYMVLETVKERFPYC